MRTHVLRLALGTLVSTGLLVGCGDDNSDANDSGPDSGIRDFGFRPRPDVRFDLTRRRPDAGRDLRVDAPVDATADSSSDAQLADAAPDTQKPDTQPPDMQPPDTQMPDTQPPDTLPPDTGPPVGTLLLDSVSNFSNLQGTSRVFYGYYDYTADVTSGDGTYSTDEFVLMSQFSQSVWWVRNGSGGFWTSLSAGAGHPNGMEGSSGRVQVVHWAIRRWRSSYTGWVTISGNVSKATAGGDGVGFNLFVDGQTIWSSSLAPNDTQGFQYRICAAVQADQRIDFALTPGPADNASYDTTNMSLEVRVAAPNCGR